MARKVLSSPEAATLLGISPATLRSWRLRKRGPPYTQPLGPGSPAVYTPEEVELFMLRKK